MSEHCHTADCCPTEGPWCTKPDKYNCDSVWYALIHRYTKSQCVLGLSQFICSTYVDANPYLLYEASKNGYIELVKILLANGLDINVTDHAGLTALHRAVVYGRMKLTRFLIEHGANINALDTSNYAPLFFSRNRKMCKYLLENGANARLSIPRRDLLSEIKPLFVAYGFPVPERIHDLPLYLRDAADGAFSRRKDAIHWWFYRHP
jgi:hypothetical protein